MEFLKTLWAHPQVQAIVYIVLGIVIQYLTKVAQQFESVAESTPVA